jgi:hypothetical protein
MSTEVRCPYCSWTFAVPGEALDKPVQCPECRESFEAVLLVHTASAEGEITDRISPQAGQPLAGIAGKEPEADWEEEPGYRPRKSGFPVGLVIGLVVGLSLLIALLIGGGGVAWFLVTRARVARVHADVARAEAEKARALEAQARAQAEQARRRAEAALNGGPGAAPAPRADLQLVTKIDAYNTAAFSRDSHSALIVFPEGKLEHRTAPDFAVQGTAKLPKEAYEAVLTPDGTLIVACTDPPPGAVLPRDRRGPGDLLFFRVADLLAGKAGPEELKPAATVPVRGEVADLLLSPEGDKVYYLDRTNQTIGRVDTARMKADGELRGLAPGTDRMCLTPDGQALYTLAGGSIQRFDTAAWKPAGTFNQRFAGRDLQATNSGRVFVLDTPGPQTRVAVLDTAGAGKGETWADVGAANAILLAPDQERLYVSNWQQNPAKIAAYHIPPRGQGLPAGEVSLPANFSARGEMVVSPDGRYLLCDGGAIVSVKTRN